ncbi:Uncharacterized protein conserved in bacteria [Vibrio cholerae]|uniref:Uncharacterized protein conserved in bacteria n=1 Tax=Vibrio cholerae TaxID=666 RepID=A0A655WU58_VIBCL|nr:Uncharacterized protein conserved in bacteria [Vibrio cholerae]
MLTQLFFGCRNNSQINGDRLITAHSLYHMILQHAEHFQLHGQRHALDFIQKQRAFIGQFQFANPPLHRTGKRARFMAEQFTFKQIFWDRATVDRHKLTTLTLAGLMQTLRYEFFATAGFAVNDHVGIHRCDFGDLLAQQLNRLTLPNQDLL